MAKNKSIKGGKWIGLLPGKPKSLIKNNILQFFEKNGSIFAFTHQVFLFLRFN